MYAVVVGAYCIQVNANLRSTEQLRMTFLCVTMLILRNYLTLMAFTISPCWLTCFAINAK